MWDDIGVMLYNIKNNRWCNNIGRFHKSNGIYLIADLQAGDLLPGIATCFGWLVAAALYNIASNLMDLLQAGVWHQRCYDPECRDYRSEAMPLPLEVVRYGMTRSLCCALHLSLQGSHNGVDAGHAC